MAAYSDGQCSIQDRAVFRKFSYMLERRPSPACARKTTNAVRLPFSRCALFRCFSTNVSGVAAVEFAFLAPIIILLYVGAGELSEAVMTSRKVEALSRTLVDLVSQQPTSGQTLSTPAPSNATTQTALQTILTAATAVLSPASLTPLQMTVSAVDTVNNAAGLCCSFKVRWSYTQSGSLRPCNVNLTPVSPTQLPSPATISSAMIPPVPYLPNPVPILIADVSYTYQAPFLAQWINFAGGMTRTSYMLPRTTGQIVMTAPITVTGNQSGVICY